MYGKKLTLADVKKKVAEHLKTVFGIQKFTITYARQEEDVWKVNVEFEERSLGRVLPTSAMFSIDLVSGEVKEFVKGHTWRV